ncbi:MAG TPA: DUF4058 family protein [Pirellulaceae bacterium]|nr:DUF4058 family protein [Pirellulaceae bacterium]
MSRSPFPGMDPWLERHWGDIHTKLVTYASDALNEHLPADLRCQSEERVYIGTDDYLLRQRRPDVFIVPQDRPLAGTEVASEGGVAVAEAEPIVVLFEPEPIREAYLIIVDAATGNRVITVIEFLSPANKLQGAGREEYLMKRNEYQRGGVNTVEIDLTRTGHRAEVLPIWRLQGEHALATYHACVQRASQPHAVEFYPIPLAQPLPSIKIPLRPDDPDVRLDLQYLIQQAYSRGRYDFLDYSQPPDPQLGERDGPVAAEILKAVGRR